MIVSVYLSKEDWGFVKELGEASNRSVGKQIRYLIAKEREMMK